MVLLHYFRNDGFVGLNCRLFSPVIIVAYVCVVGLGIYGRGFPKLSKCVEIGLPMLIFFVVFQQRLHHRAHPILERFALLFCIALIWASDAILTVAGAYNNVGNVTKQSCRTDRSYLLETAPWSKMSYPFQWGAPIFRASHVFQMMGAAILFTVEKEDRATSIRDRMPTGRGNIVCATCNADQEPGVYKENQISPCAACYGRSLIAHRDGSDTMCVKCNGKGKIPCATCGSRGLIKFLKCAGSGSLSTRKIAVVKWLYRVDILSLKFKAIQSGFVKQYTGHWSLRQHHHHHHQPLLRH